MSFGDSEGSAAGEESPAQDVENVDSDGNQIAKDGKKSQPKQKKDSTINSKRGKKKKE